MSACGVLFSLFLLLFFSLNDVNAVVSKNETVVEEMVPVMEYGAETTVVMLNEESRRRLNGFQICALCTCCGGSKPYCMPSPCCFAINCNIPNRPFGFCAFTPKTCNCFGCHL